MNKGLRVTLKPNENITQALKRFKRKLDESKKLEDLRKKEYYEKPSVTKKRAKGAARSRYLKKLAKEEALLNDIRSYKK